MPRQVVVEDFTTFVKRSMLVESKTYLAQAGATLHTCDDRFRPVARVSIAPANLTMYLLNRSVSPYTDCEQLLGVFTSLPAGEAARQSYISSIQSSALTDPFADQAYHEVSLTDDIELVSDIKAIDVPPGASEVYVVSSYAEGFGQVVRKFEAICGNRELAMETAAQVESAAKKCPISAVVDQILVNQLIAEANDDEPID